jgi:hypothetical protein
MVIVLRTEMLKSSASEPQKQGLTSIYSSPFPDLQLSLSLNSPHQEV